MQGFAGQYQMRASRNLGSVMSCSCQGRVENRVERSHETMPHVRRRDANSKRLDLAQERK